MDVHVVIAWQVNRLGLRAELALLILGRSRSGLLRFDYLDLVGVAVYGRPPMGGLCVPLAHPAVAEFPAASWLRVLAPAWVEERGSGDSPPWAAAFRFVSVVLSSMAAS